MLKHAAALARCVPLAVVFLVNGRADSPVATNSVVPTGPGSEQASSLTKAPSTNQVVQPPLVVPDPVKNLVGPILDTKICDAVELSPDQKWLAVTRSYAMPKPGEIWKVGEGHVILLVREVEDQDTTGAAPDLQLADDYFSWEAPASISVGGIEWSPDSRFLLLLCSSAQGHQPWAFSVAIMDMKDGEIHSSDPLGTIVSPNLKFTGPDTVQLMTGTPDSPKPIDFKLESHVHELPLVVRLERQAMSR